MDLFILTICLDACLALAIMFGQPEGVVLFAKVMNLWNSLLAVRILYVLHIVTDTEFGETVHQHPLICLLVAAIPVGFGGYYCVVHIPKRIKGEKR